LLVVSLSSPNFFVKGANYCYQSLMTPIFGRTR